MGEDSTVAKVNKLAVLGAAAAAVTGIAGTERAEASIIYSGIVNINIPTTTAGVYLNVVTGVSSTTPAGAPGWDVNPWSSSGLGFFNPVAPAGGVYVVTAPSSVANLAPSAAIGAGNTYGSGSFNTAQLVLNSQDNLVGFRFQNEANANATHYGWMRIGLSSSITAQPRSIIEYAYDDVAGREIQAGATGQQTPPVPEPASLGLLAMGVSGLVARRLRRSQAN